MLNTNNFIIFLDYFVSPQVRFPHLCKKLLLFSRANGNPGPDPYYIDQAKNILYELEHLGIPEVCEDR